MTHLWEIQEALNQDTDSLRKQLVSQQDREQTSQAISADACRFALVLRGEDPKRYIHT